MSDRVDVRDVLAVVGFGALIYGVSRWSVPAAFVVAGVLLLVVSMAPAIRWRRAGAGSPPGPR